MAMLKKVIVVASVLVASCGVQQSTQSSGEQAAGGAHAAGEAYAAGGANEAPTPDNGDNDSETGAIEYVGIFSFEKGQTPVNGGAYPLAASARFLKLTAKSNPYDISASLLSLGDNCTVVKNGNTIAGQTTPLAFNDVSAGEVVTLQSDGTSYPDLVKQGEEYQLPAASNPMTFDVFPNELLLNAPGDAFPPIVDFRAQLGNGIIGVSVGRNGDSFDIGPRRPLVFHKDINVGWRGGENPNSYVKISLYSGTEHSATCYAPDEDWKWVFPANIQRLMEASYQDLEISRVQLTSTVTRDTYILSISEDLQPLY